MDTLLYETPVVYSPKENLVEETELPLLGWVIAVYGSAWAFCQATCGWQKVKSCSASWRGVKAVCK